MCFALYWICCLFCSCTRLISELFFFFGKPGSYCIPRAANRVRGGMQPHKFTCGSALAAATLKQGAPGSHSQDTASGTSPTWPLASGSVDCTLYTTPPEDFVPAPSIKRTSPSNPKGPLRGGAAGQHHPALWAFYTPKRDTLSSLPLAACQW